MRAHEQDDSVAEFGGGGKYSLAVHGLERDAALGAQTGKTSTQQEKKCLIPQAS
jgi:hypothetical protein